MRKGPSSTQGGDDFTSRKAPFANPLKHTFLKIYERGEREIGVTYFHATNAHLANEETIEMLQKGAESTEEDANSCDSQRVELLQRNESTPQQQQQQHGKKPKPPSLLVLQQTTKRVVEKTAPLLRLSGLTQFIVGSGAVGLAVGLVVGGCIKDVVDSFTAAFISPLIALIGGKREIEDLYFSAGSHTRFEYGKFLGVMLETFCTLFFVYYLIVIPMNALTSFKYGPLVKCHECQSWIKESAKKCPNCCSYLDERGKRQRFVEKEEEEEEEPRHRMRHSRSLSDEVMAMRW